MATPLDVSLLQPFKILFPFLLILVFLYAIFIKFNWFKDKQSFAFIAAFLFAIMTLFSSVATEAVNKMAPWFVIVFVVTIFTMIAFQVFGITETTIVDTLTSKEYGTVFANTFIIIILIIAIGSLASSYSEHQGFLSLRGVNTTAIAQAEGEETAGFVNVLVHPKVLGILLLLVIASFTVRLLSEKAKFP